MRDLTDGEILKLFCDRDEKAIEECKKSYGKICGSVALNILNNREDAEEVLNDVYLQAWETVHVKRPAELLPYLVTVTRNISVSKLRALTAGKRHAASIPIDELEDILPDDLDKESAYGARVLGELINGFLKGLLPRDRRIFILRYYANLKIREISKKTRRLRGSRENVAWQIKNRLQKHLERNGYYNE